MTQKTKKPDRPPRILVIDDERSVLEAIRMTLEHYGFGVTTCTSGLKAIEVFKTGKFDVVVTDYAMPELKGDELAAMIKEISPGCPILMLTAHAEMVDRKKLKTVDCVLSKPFMPQALNAAIKRSLKQV